MSPFDSRGSLPYRIHLSIVGSGSAVRSEIECGWIVVFSPSTTTTESFRNASSRSSFRKALSQGTRPDGPKASGRLSRMGRPETCIASKCIRTGQCEVNQRVLRLPADPT